MIVGYHVIFGAYGFWLPNDPRGSWSEFVGSYELYRAGGRTTKTPGTCPLPTAPHDHEHRLATKLQLQRPPISLAAEQVQSIGLGFETYVRLSGLAVWACAVMPEHVHLVTGCFRFAVEKVAIRLKAAATQRLIADGVHPFQHLKLPDKPPPKCFAEGEWKVFLAPEDVEPAIHYVEQNPVKAGLPPQTWPFVTTPGHDVFH
jgi:REP element-mobilizing transposase RayT